MKIFYNITQITSLCADHIQIFNTSGVVFPRVVNVRAGSADTSHSALSFLLQSLRNNGSALAEFHKNFSINLRAKSGRTRLDLSIWILARYRREVGREATLPPAARRNACIVISFVQLTYIFLCEILSKMDCHVSQSLIEQDAY